MMAKGCVICLHINIVIIIVMGTTSIGGGLYFIFGFNHMNEDLAGFDDAKDQIHVMIKAINRYPAVRIHNPPNVTNVDPLKELGFNRLVGGFGYLFLAYGTVLCALSAVALAANIRKSTIMLAVYTVAMTIVLILAVAIVVIYLKFPEFIHKFIKSHFTKSIMDSYIGLSGNNSVSMAWNVVMRKFNCCGIDGHQDFNSSTTFNDVWGEPFHTVTDLNRMSTPLICCDAITIQARRPRFNGPCHEKEYLHKKGCLSVFLEVLENYKIFIVCFVVFSCVLKILLTIMVGYNKLQVVKQTPNKIQPMEEEKLYSGKRDPPSRKPSVRH